MPRVTKFYYSGGYDDVMWQIVYLFSEEYGHSWKSSVTASLRIMKHFDRSPEVKSVTVLKDGKPMLTVDKKACVRRDGFKFGTVTLYRLNIPEVS